MPFKWVPNAAETAGGFHDVNLGFCPANSQLYLAAAKPPGGNCLPIVTIEHLAYGG
jgi:hypothetical protein